MEWYKNGFRKGEINIKERFSIQSVFLLPLTLSTPNYLKLDFNYPPRFCVIDKEKKIAIDIQMGLKYDYIETKSNLFVLNEHADKIKENKRVAMGNITNLSNIDENTIKLGKKIIKKIQNNDIFIDGNDVLSNEEYLQIVNIQTNLKFKVKTKVRKSKKKNKIMFFSFYL